ncbi:hypothetical protein RRG08_035650 [Elysia crispata]|uniref:Uncharacterized protein n=1 Tax=Elysia crispata TaxID=231223 RepID=A0AAE1CVH6_9GAST|nr:hypothetical protein RRG08_035650 [Elysia crispata]
MFVGKNLESSLDRWKELIGAVSGCHHVMDWIKDGIRIPFSNLPIDFEIENKHFSTRENDFISKELERLLKSGCIASCKEKPKCVSPISTVPKKDSFRLITDLRRMNAHCETRSCGYEDIKSVIDLAEADHIQLATDASGEGLGGIIVDSHQEAQGAWDRSTSSRSSNFREISAVLMTLTSFLPLLKGKSGYSFPPPFHDVSALISSFMKLKSDLSERPESMLRSIQAALTHFFAAAWDSNPFDADIKKFVTALIKVRTKHASGRTIVMPIKPITDLFCKWGENHELSIKHLRQKTIALLSLSMMARPSDLAPAMGFHRNQLGFSEYNSVVIPLCGIKNDSDRHGFEIKIDKILGSNIQINLPCCNG